MISIVIPVLNEELIIGDALKRLQCMSGEYEIIVVDGGSSDGTAEVANSYVKTISSTKGRGIQMNTGAREAIGDVLLFLHADTIVKQDAIDEISRVMSEQNVVGGTFKRKYDVCHPLLKLAAFYTYTNFYLFGIIAGDQGIFVRKDIFNKIGGFPEIQLMEEVQFTKNLKKCGKIAFLNSEAIVSARRFMKKGIVRTYLTMLFCIISYRFGMPPEKIKDLYVDVR